MRVLLVGGSGQIGTELRRRAPADWQIHAPDRTQMDLLNADSLEAGVGSSPWDAVVNAAAYTAVDRAEDEVELSWITNAIAPSIMAETTARNGVPLLHLSTDYVFDGRKSAPYVEDDPVAPVGVYGASKEAGERTVRKANPRHLILRIAWVVSPYGNNFVKTMLRLGTERSTLRVVSDQRGCPTSAADVALALIEILPRLVGAPTSYSGTYHFVNDGDASWFELAQFIFAVAAEMGEKIPAVQAISTSQYPTRARRPLNSRLSTEKLRRDFGINPRHWKPAVRDVVQSLLLSRPKE